MPDDPPFPTVRPVRVPIPMRLRFAAEAMNAMQAVKQLPATAGGMQQRRVFRMAMEKQRRRVLKLWRGTIR